MNAPAPAARQSFWRRLYDWTLHAARHKHADWYLSAVSFADSSFFPFPPDIVLAPMVLARPWRWFWLASLTVITSVVGGLLGYWIGATLIGFALPMIEELGYQEAYAETVRLVQQYGFWALVIKGLTPVPYKLFTIAAGATSMNMLEFVGASIISRSIRFYAVAGLVRAAGPRMEPVILKYIDWFGWGVLALLVLLIVWVAL